MTTVDDDAQSIMGALLTNGKEAANSEYQRIVREKKLRYFEAVVLLDKFRALCEQAEIDLKSGRKINGG